MRFKVLGAPVLLALVGTSLLVKLRPEIQRPTIAQLPLTARGSVSQSYGKLPLSFEANHGQTDTRVKFLSRGRGYTLFLTPTEAVLALRKSELPRSRHPIEVLATAKAPDVAQTATTAALHIKLVGANPAPRIAGQEALPGKANYFIGNDPKKWRTNVPTYAKVKYHAVYPGVDLVFYGNQRQLEDDFILAPGAKPDLITIGFDGAEKLSLDARGDLVLSNKDGEARLQKPVVYQEVDGLRQEISGSYLLKDSDQVGFRLGAYDASRALVIDPVLEYSTYLGGSSADEGSAIAVDSAGSAYVTGATASTNFPTTSGAFQTTLGGSGAVNAFVTKLSPDGSALVYSTYLGGSSGGGNPAGLTTGDSGNGIAVDSAGSAYVTGRTESTDFPISSGAFQTALRGPLNAFVTKLSSDGSALLYSTYLGGSGSDYAGGSDGFGGNPIAVDSAGSAYVTGVTSSSNFPTTSGAFQTALRCSGGTNAFVTKLSADGSALVYSTYLGGSGPIAFFNMCDSAYGIALDSAGSAYVTGQTSSKTDFPTTSGAFQTTYGGGRFTAFVTKLNAAGTALVYSTYLGGTDSGVGIAIAVDSRGSAYVTGRTRSNDFPTTLGAFQTTYNNGGFDAFVTKLNAAGTALVYSTYLGFEEVEGRGIAVDCVGDASVTGFAATKNFPTTPGAIKTPPFVETVNVFVTRFNREGTALVYSTLLGGSNVDDGRGIAVDSAGSAYVTGLAQSTDFPTTPGAFKTFGRGSGFVAKINAFAFPCGSGSFVIGDLNATVGDTVTFWGAQWAKDNSLSGGSAPHAFKGFADNAPQSCGGNWTSDPGNSSNPPDTVPPYMAVIASSSITKSGHTITGNVPEIVVVQTNPGYGPSPGHAGTGTVVAVLCGP